MRALKESFSIIGKKKKNKIAINTLATSFAGACDNERCFMRFVMLTTEKHVVGHNVHFTFTFYPIISKREK